MSLKVSEVLTDPIVIDTMKALQGKTGRNAPSADEINEHPVLTLLEKTGSLDSVTAAVIVSDEMLRGSRAGQFLHLLPPAVAEPARLLQDSYDKGQTEGVSAMIADGNPTALKIALAAVSYAGTGREFDIAKNQMGRNEVKELATQMIDLSIEGLEALVDNNRWHLVQPGLLKAFYEATENLSEYAEPAARRRLLAASQDALRAELATAGIDLPSLVTAQPATLPPAFNPSMKVTEVLKDPLVLETLKALNVAPADVDLSSKYPVLTLLADADTLDSVTAAALIAIDYNHRRAELPREVKEVVDVIGNEMMAYAGPAALFNGGNVTLHKIGVAALVEALSEKGFAEARNMSQRQLKEGVKELSDMTLFVTDSMIAAKSWQGMSPKLIDQLTAGIDRLKPFVEGKVPQKLLAIAAQDLKSAVAKGNAADITAPVPGKSQPAAPKPKKGGLNP